LVLSMAQQAPDLHVTGVEACQSQCIIFIRPIYIQIDRKLAFYALVSR